MITIKMFSTTIERKKFEHLGETTMTLAEYTAWAHQKLCEAYHTKVFDIPEAIRGKELGVIWFVAPARPTGVVMYDYIVCEVK